MSCLESFSKEQLKKMNESGRILYAACEKGDSEVVGSLLKVVGFDPRDGVSNTLMVSFIEFIRL